MPAGAGPFVKPTSPLPAWADRSDVLRRFAPAVSARGRSAPVTAPHVPVTSGGLIPNILNIQQLQLQLNTILATIYLSLPSYGAALPSALGLIDGALYTVVTPSSETRYQLQNGTWVAI